MNLLKDNTKEKVEKIMNISNKSAMTNVKEEQIKKILKEDTVLKKKEEKLIKIVKGNPKTEEIRKQIKEILMENESEEIEKNKELEDIKLLYTAKLKPILELLKINGNPWSNKKTEACMDIFRKAKGKISEVNLDGKVSQEEWNRFLRVKDELDKILIEHIRTKLLKETIDCCFVGYQGIVFKYPKLFYYLKGHFFEEIIYSMFFDQSTKFEKSMLIDKIVQENGLMNECGYLVPNDLCEIFKRIDRFKMTRLRLFCLKIISLIKIKHYFISKLQIK